MNENKNRRRGVRLAIAGGAIALLVLAVLFLPRLFGGSTFSRHAEADSYALEMGPLNTTLEETYALRQGDAIEVSLAQTGGEVSITIGQKGQTPIYEGRNPPLDSFQVMVTEDGEYIISVTGRQARGSVSFRILRVTE